MNNHDRQIVLETKMYRKKSYGKEKFCKHCCMKLINGCFALAKPRTMLLLCCKAECRMLKIPFNLREIIYAPSAKDGRPYGLTKQEKLK